MFNTFYCLRDVCFIMSKNLINVNFLLTSLHSKKAVNWWNYLVLSMYFRPNSRVNGVQFSWIRKFCVRRKGFVYLE